LVRVNLGKRQLQEILLNGAAIYLNLELDEGFGLLTDARLFLHAQRIKIALR
jgi:hypothetical protein